MSSGGSKAPHHSASRLLTWEDIQTLPATLARDEILTVNASGLSPEIHSTRPYEWRGISLVVPPGVFRPGPTARLIHDRLMDGLLPVSGKRYAAMGVGLGVEAVAAGMRGAGLVLGVDIHSRSVEVAQANFDFLVGTGAFRGVVSDLWENVEISEQLDVVTFNPPFIDTPLSSDPDLARNMCQGFRLAIRFFEQMRQKSVLARGGVIYVVLSNTAPLRDFVGLAISSGYRVEALHEQGWQGERVRTFLFALHSR